MTRAQLEALAARFEAAPANDAALFFEALDALALPRALHYRIVRFIYGEAFLDAAASLVPEGWEVAVYWAVSRMKPEAQLERAEVRDVLVSAEAATPALALAAAALRARAMEAGDE
jgi:hypothetical protein